MKKQFFRVKQLADQTFLRAEKSKQLSDELQDADQKVEYLRGALAAVSKRLPQPNSSIQEKDNFEKRLKKLVEYQLGMVMKEYGAKKEESLDQEDTLLRPVLQKCGKAQIELAREMSEHECKIESMVSQPIQIVLENDIPAILKTKRTLSKLILDKDSATNRYQTASKHGTKNESIREEMEEAEQKVEHCRDSLAAEMFSLLRRESEFAQFMLQMMKLQRGYHESALHTLEELIPELEREIGNSPVKAVYGCPLEEHLRLSKRQIALPLELCVCALWELGMKEEGLFRVAGGTSRVRRMKLSLDSGCFSPPLQLEYRDVHVIASALKSYLRELPEPLLTYKLYPDWMRAAKCATEDQRIDAITHVLQRLPTANYDNLRYLIMFLAELSKNPINKMTSSNIAIVMAPNLLWSVHEVSNGIDMNSATIVNSIVEILLSQVDRFFPGEQLQVYQTFKRDDLFPDLTEFERPSITHHLRSSSNDTALIHLEDINNSAGERNNSPPQGSPKPVSRKKNKPAPIPPVAMISNDSKPPQKPVHFASGSSTINRTTYKQQKLENDMNGKSKMSVSIGTSDEFNSLNRRKSLDFDHPNIQTLTNTKYNIPLMKKSDLHINKNDISSPINTETTVNIDNLKSTELVHTIHQITAQNATVGKIKIASVEPFQTQKNTTLNNNNTNAKQTPVAAPRTSLLETQCQKPPTQQKNLNSTQNISKSLNEIDCDGEMVELRRASREEFLNRPNKPVVPERPATLRPSSFRMSKQANDIADQQQNVGSTVNLTSAAALERTHVYNVADKHQVSFVHLQQLLQKEKGHDSQMAEKEKFLMSNSTIDFRNQVPMPRHSLETSKLEMKPLETKLLDSNKVLDKTDFNFTNNNSTTFEETSGTNLVRTLSMGARNSKVSSNKPPKPEMMKSLERLNIEQSNGNHQVSRERHHSRTLSDGDLIDTISAGGESPLSPRSPTGPPASPRGTTRPPRPQPPPPPPPVRPRSDGESTDL